MSAPGMRCRTTLEQRHRIVDKAIALYNMRNENAFGASFVAAFWFILGIGATAAWLYGPTYAVSIASRRTASLRNLLVASIGTAVGFQLALVAMLGAMTDVSATWLLTWVAAGGLIPVLISLLAVSARVSAHYKTRSGLAWGRNPFS